MLINLTFLSLVLFLSFSLFYFSHLLPLCWSTHIDTWINWQRIEAWKKKDSNKQLLRQTRCLILMMRRRRRDGLGVRRCKTGRIYGHYGHWCWLLWWNDIFICSYSLLAQLHSFFKFITDSIRRTLAAVTVRQSCVSENDERMNQHIVWRPLEWRCEMWLSCVMMRGIRSQIWVNTEQPEPRGAHSREAPQSN